MVGDGSPSSEWLEFDSEQLLLGRGKSGCEVFTVRDAHDIGQPPRDTGVARLAERGDRLVGVEVDGEVE